MLEEVALCICQFSSSVRLALGAERNQATQHRVAYREQIIRHEEVSHALFNRVGNPFSIRLTDRLKCQKHDILKKVLAEYPVVLVSCFFSSLILDSDFEHSLQDGLDLSFYGVVAPIFMQVNHLNGET